MGVKRVYNLVFKVSAFGWTTNKESPVYNSNLFLFFGKFTTYSQCSQCDFQALIRKNVKEKLTHTNVYYIFKIVL